MKDDKVGTACDLMAMMHCKILVRKLEENRPLGRSKHKWQDDIKTDESQTCKRMVLVLNADELLGQNRPMKYLLMMDDDECDDVDWFHQVKDRNQ